MRRESEGAKMFSKPTQYKRNAFLVRSIKMHVRVQKEFCSFIIPTLDGGSEWSASHPGHFTFQYPLRKRLVGPQKQYRLFEEGRKRLQCIYPQSFWLSIA